jgi:nicotinate-nucleotide pyrophosphorylase (carboxylating)
MDWHHPGISEAIRRALAEDIGTGDVTTEACVAAGAMAKGYFLAREPMTLAGVELLPQIYETEQTELLLLSGARAEADLVFARVNGNARRLLTLERTALNFLQRLSGVASLTRRFVDKVQGTGTTILDTRKTTPGLRYLEKYAVKMGGGDNHRFALWDMYLLKDNHIRAAGGITPALDRIQRTRQDVPLEVEVESLTQLHEALRPEVDRILVDNRPVDEVRHAVEEVDRWFERHPPESRRMRRAARRWPEIEVSGGITLDSVQAYAETGVDYISVGALTHSAPALNLSLEIEDVG